MGKIAGPAKEWLNGQEGWPTWEYEELKDKLKAEFSEWYML